MGAKDLLLSFGLSEVELPEPDGFAARIRLPTPQELMRQGEMDPALRRLLMKVGREQVSADAEPTDEQVDSGVDITFVRAARMIRAVRTGRDEEWEPIRFTLGEFLDLPTEAQNALLSIASGQRTPGMVTALVRRHRGEITSAEAAALIDAESARIADGWDSFRPQQPGTRDGAGGGGMEEGAERLPADDVSGTATEPDGPALGGHGAGASAQALPAPH